MSMNGNGGEGLRLPDFAVSTPQVPVQMNDGSAPVTAAEAVAGMRNVFGLGEDDRIDRCYAGNLPGPEGGLQIGVVIVEADGFMKDRKIVVNDERRHPLLGERAITWVGSLAVPYDKAEYVGFMRGEIASLESVELAA